MSNNDTDNKTTEDAENIHSLVLVQVPAMLIIRFFVKFNSTCTTASSTIISFCFCLTFQSYFWLPDPLPVTQPTMLKLKI